MYHTIEEFLADWRMESLGTLRILRAVTDASLTQRVNAEGRSLGFLAWHLVLTLGEMGGKAGLQITAPAEDAQPPTTTGEIVRAYHAASDSLAADVKSRWSNDALKEEIAMYGEKWTRSQTLSALIKHQTHHRAQMTVLMRQAGLKVPGIYGPAREEWAQMGMPPQQ